MGRVWRALLSAFGASGRKSTSLVAAAIAFYMLFAIFPGVSVAVSLTGLVADPATLSLLVEEIAPFAPEGAVEILEAQIENTLTAGQAQLSATALVSFLLAFWSAGAAGRALIGALQLSFPSTHDYSFLASIALSSLVTLGALLMVTLTVVVMVALPIGFEAIRAIDASPAYQATLDVIARFEPLVLIALAASALTILYVWGARRGFGSTGAAFGAALITTLLWLGASRLLAYYVANFADLSATYGPSGAVAGLMLWLWVSAFLLLFGVELTAALAGDADDVDDDTTTAPDAA